MNARQKAKKYKKIAETYKYKADILDSIILAENFKKSTQIKKLETFKMTKIIDNLSYTNSRYFLFEREIARDIGEWLLKNGFVGIRACNDEILGNTRLSIWVEAVRQVGGNVCDTEHKNR